MQGGREHKNILLIICSLFNYLIFMERNKEKLKLHKKKYRAFFLSAKMFAGVTA